MNMRLVICSVLACAVSFASYAQGCNTISSKVCRLTQPYTKLSDPSDPDRYTPPQCTNEPTYTSAIEAAFQRSSQSLKADLCTIDKFIVVPSDIEDEDDHSWGNWENPQTYKHQMGCPANGCSYIGIAINDFGKNVHQIEDNHLISILPNTRISHRHSPASSNPTPANTLGLMSVLAHEMAHIKFNRDGGRTKPCFIQYFVQNSWDDIGDTMQRRWTSFKEEIGRPKIPRTTDPNNHDAVYNIYNGGHASLLSNKSPEEDYVEAYKFGQLRSGVAQGPGRVIIKIPGRSGDREITLNSRRNSQLLTDKMRCAMS